MPDPVQTMLSSPLLLGTAELTALVLLSAALGRLALQRFRLASASPAERGVLALGLGLGLLSFLPFLLFATGLGAPSVFRIVLPVLVLLLMPQIVAVCWSAWRWLRTPHPLSWWERWIFALFAALSLACYLRALCPPTGGDALTYHLPAPMRYLTLGRFVYLPTLTPTNWPMGIQMLFALLLAFSRESPVAIVEFLFGMLTLCTTYLFARRATGRFGACVTVCLLLLFNLFWAGMTMAIVDVGLTGMTTLAAFALYGAFGSRRWHISPEPHKPSKSATEEASPAANENAGWDYLAALFAGLAAATKLTGLWVVITFVVVRALIAHRHEREQAIRTTLTFAILAVLPVLPWLAKTWILTGNPFYPMLYRIFGGIEWTAQGWAIYERGNLLWNAPGGMTPTPRVLALTHYLIATVSLLMCAWVLRATRSSTLAIPARVAAIFTVCICAGAFFHPRFLMPVAPAIFLCLSALFKRETRLRAFAVCLLATFPAVSQILHGDYPTLPTAWSLATGHISRQQYSREQLPVYPVAEYANQHLPTNARILLGDYDYYVSLYHAEALWPEYWQQDSLHFFPPERLEADLKRLHVRYLVLQPIYPDWCARSFHCAGRQKLEPPALTALAARRGIALFAANGYTLYALSLP